MRVRELDRTSLVAGLVTTVAGLVHGAECFVTLVHGDTALAFTQDVTGFEANPTGSESFATVSIASE